jgi:hypothetical protein
LYRALIINNFFGGNYEETYCFCGACLHRNDGFRGRQDGLGRGGYERSELSDYYLDLS